MLLLKNPYKKNTKIYKLYEKIKVIPINEHLLFDGNNLFLSKKFYIYLKS